MTRTTDDATRPEAPDGGPRRVADGLPRLTREIMRQANLGLPRTEFLKEVSRLLFAHLGIDALELRLWGDPPAYRWSAENDGSASGRLIVTPDAEAANPESACRCEEDPTLEAICRAVAKGTSSAACRAPDTELRTSHPATRHSQVATNDSRLRWPLVAAIRFDVSERSQGILLLCSHKPDYFTDREVPALESLAQTVGLSISDRRAQAALRERVKELTCLYGITRLAELPEAGVDDILAGVARLLLPAMQYPELAAARVAVDDREFRSGPVTDTGRWLSAEVTVAGRNRGRIAVGYPEPGEVPEEALFLPEEQALLDGIAAQVSLITERKEAEAARIQLEQQLRHSDRLATIGQLSAGIAHELNEPLGSILGFAQLVLKTPDIRDQAAQDLNKIVKASLHAREVIRKLMLFARRVPPRTTRTNVNELMEEGLYFLESRCVKNGIKLIRSLDPDLPEIEADPAQLLQVLVNLMVNAIQAMPHGGTLTLSTAWEPGVVLLKVEDTGVGMSEEVKGKIFVPFFSTKQPHEGTGLGLSVVHDIVTTHGGSIQVESKIGMGSRFTVRLPAQPEGTLEGQEDGKP